MPLCNNMKDSIKLKDEELKAIQDIQEKNGVMLGQFGTLYLDKMQIDEAIKVVASKEQRLQDEWTSLRKQENELIDKIIKSYGEGSLDMKNGTFLPDDNTPKTS
jgi:hypothetical protein